MSLAVEVQCLSKRYTQAFSKKSVLALDEVDLQVERGEIFGLLGPNGAGKTTLVKLLLSIVRPTTGTATLFGNPIHQPEARRRIGYLPENHRFPDFLTARQMLDLYGRMGRLPNAQRQQHIPALLESVNMTKWRDMKIKKFSKGMMQRVGLAQALLGDTALIFLDEPTDGVDPVGRREIRDLLLELRAAGKTIFLNSHLLSEVEQVCTRVAILNQGRVVREGSIAELTTADLVYDILSTPIPHSLLATLSTIIRPSPEAPTTDTDLCQYRVQPKDRNELNSLLDRLRSENVLFEAVNPVRQSLEEYFIEVVKDKA